MADEVFPTAAQKLNSRTLWVTAGLFILGLGLGIWIKADWLSTVAKDMVGLALFSAGIMVGKAGR